jgi:hypothetical protein
MATVAEMHNLQASLVKGLLSKDFYTRYAAKVPEDFLSKQYKPLRRTLDFAHKKYSRDLSLHELDTLHRANNPTLTEAQKVNLRELMSELNSAPDIGADVAADVLEVFWKQEYGRQFAEIGIQMMNGEVDGGDGLVSIQSLIERCDKQFTPTDDVDYQSMDIGDILDQTSGNDRWKFNIPPLAQAITGVAPTHFIVAAARINTGKTSLHATLSAAPGGWAWQGARIAVALNEEASPRIAERYVTAATGLTREQIAANRPYAHSLFAPIAKNINMFRDSDMTITKLNAYCKRHKPDILIVDMIDKAMVPGTFAREDQMFRAIYREAREIGNRHNCVVMGFSQLSAEAEGKTQLNQSMLEGSRTGKAAEADLMLLIGRGASSDATTDDDGIRYLTIAKNKLNGVQRRIPMMLHREIGRYTE